MDTITDVLTEMRSIVSLALDENRSLTEDEQSRITVLEARKVELSEIQAPDFETEGATASEARAAEPEVRTPDVAETLGTVISHETTSTKETTVDHEIRSYLQTGEARALSVSSAGALVPEYLHNTVLEAAADANFVRGLALVIGISSEGKVPFRGAAGKATIKAEGQAYGAGTTTITPVELSSFKYTYKEELTEELMADSAFDVEGILAKNMGESFGNAE
jgi:HK97 family phage major capsid protein